MTADIPENAHKYAESPIFTEITVPEKLTTLHDTKSGVWGRLCVLDGRLKYIIPGPPLFSSIIEAGDIGNNADSLTMASHVVATNFQTIAAANHYWLSE